MLQILVSFCCQQLHFAVACSCRCSNVAAGLDPNKVLITEQFYQDLITHGPQVCCNHTRELNACFHQTNELGIQPVNHLVSQASPLVHASGVGSMLAALKKCLIAHLHSSTLLCCNLFEV